MKSRASAGKKAKDKNAPPQPDGPIDDGLMGNSGPVGPKKTPNQDAGNPPKA